jgi:hypothetical protein
MASHSGLETQKNRQSKEGVSAIMLMTAPGFVVKSKPPFIRKILRQLIAALKHPFVLLVIGAITTSLLVPYLNSKVNRNQLLREARLKKAIEIGDQNTEFNSKLNALKTMLESFHRQNVRLQLQPVELREAKLRFRDDFTKRYLELDEKAWWWYSDLQREASVMGLTSTDELRTLGSNLGKYADNVNKSFDTLRPLWQALTSHDYDPNDQASRDKVEKIIAEVNDAQNGLPSLFQARNVLIDGIAGYFASLQ